MSPRAFEGRYTPEPLNTGSGLDAKIDDRVQQFIQSAQFTGAAVPQSIPQQTVIRPVVTSLPTTATDGDEVRFVADSANGVVWLLRYRDSGNAYPWEFLGGSPLFASVDTDETTTSTTYAALATAGPTITVPLAGDYDVTISGQTYASVASATLHSYDIGGVGAVDTNAADNGHSSATVSSPYSATNRHTALAAGAALVSKYRISTAGTANFRRRRMRVTPVRVGLS